MGAVSNKTKQNNNIRTIKTSKTKTSTYIFLKRQDQHHKTTAMNSNQQN